MEKFSAVILNQLKCIKKKHSNALVLIREDDSYRAIGGDAVHTAQILGLTLSKINGVEHAEFSANTLDSNLLMFVKPGQFNSSIRKNILWQSSFSFDGFVLKVLFCSNNKVSFYMMNPVQHLEVIVTSDKYTVRAIFVRYFFHHSLNRVQLPI